MNHYRETGTENPVKDGSFSKGTHPQLEFWSPGALSMAPIDSKGKFVVQNVKKKKKKCPLGRKIVGSMFFRSVVYNAEGMLDTAMFVLENRRRDLDEFNHYVQEDMVEEDHAYRRELAREIVYWNKMIALYKFVIENRDQWVSRGKFPWSGYKAKTPYFDAPSNLMTSVALPETATKDTDMIPVEAIKNDSQVELSPVAVKKKRKKA